MIKVRQQKDEETSETQKKYIRSFLSFGQRMMEGSSIFPGKVFVHFERSAEEYAVADYNL
jgi:hypothetical protein